MYLEKLINHIVRRMELRYQRKEGCLHVRDLVSCRLKKELEETYSVLHKAVYYAPAVLLGEVVHWGIEMLFGKEETQREFKREIDGSVIYGHPDIVLPNSIIELKYQKSLYGCPRPHHELQTQFEAWVAGKSFGTLIYISPDGWREFTYRALTDSEVRDLLVKERTPMWEEWECSYCQFNGVCPKGTIRGEKPAEERKTKER